MSVLSSLNPTKQTVFVESFEEKEDKWPLPDAETASERDMGIGGSFGRVRNYKRKSWSKNKEELRFMSVPNTFWIWHYFTRLYCSLLSYINHELLQSKSLFLKYFANRSKPQSFSNKKVYFHLLSFISCWFYCAITFHSELLSDCYSFVLKSVDQNSSLEF